MTLGSSAASGAPALTAASGRGRFLLALLGATLLSRLAGLVFGVVNIDEAEFCTIGKMICGGALSYANIAEFKPPLVHLAFAPAGFFGGPSIVPMRVLSVLWVFATALVIAQCVREWTADELAARSAAFLSLLAGLCEVPSTSAELLMDLPLALALLFFIRAEKTGKVRDDLLCGLCVGLASLFKHQGAILGVAFVCARLWGFARRERPFGLERYLGLAAGFAVPWASAIAVWQAAGHLDDFVEWMVLRNLGYASQASLFSWSRAALAVVVCVAGTALPWALATRESLRRGDPIRRGLVLALWLTWLAVGAGGRFYEHYFLQFVPPLAILAAPSAAELLRSGSRRARAIALALALLPALGYTGYTLARGLAGNYPNQQPGVIAVADWLRKNTAPTERIFVWGHAPQIYYLSKRPPGTRYLTAATQMGGFDPAHLPPGFDAGAHASRRDLDLLMRDLRQTDLFIDTAPANIHDWGRVPLAQFPELEAYVRANYRLVGSPGGALVYRKSRS